VALKARFFSSRDFVLDAQGVKSGFRMVRAPVFPLQTKNKGQHHG
jgi:hypothetical protein